MMVIRTNILYQYWNTFPGSGFINIKIIGWNEFFNTTYRTINNLIVTTFNKLFRFGLNLVDHLIHADYFPAVYDPFCCRIFWHNFYKHILLCKKKVLVKKIVTHILTNFSKGNLRQSNLLHEYANGKRNI